MCGITGFLTKTEHLSIDVLKRMNDSIYRRGPDSEGLLLEGNLGLAMRRLSIIDVEGGSQPIYNEDGSVCVFYNGEIYNAPALRASLIKNQHQFKTKSDTEVLVHLYEEYGENLVNHLEGMFAFAIWDKSLQKLFIARDHLGIKPLFYRNDESGLYFGSEIKCLKQIPGRQLSLNYQALDFFFAYTYIPAPYTIYNEIKKLPAGHCMICTDGSVSIRQYWDLPPIDHTSAIDNPLKKTKEHIVDAVKSHLLSDVPVGSFLSGGIDSGLVTAIMAMHQESPVETFTMSFEGQNIPLDDERIYARMIADQYGTVYNDYLVPPDPAAVIPEVIEAFDEPFADDSVFPSYYVSQIAASKLKVVMSGLGGDEVFAGYNRYAGLLLAQYYSKLPRWLNSYLINPLIQKIPEPRGGGEKIDHLKRFTSASSLSPANRYVSYVTAIAEEKRQKLYKQSVSERIDFDLTKSLYTELYDSYDGDDISKALYTDMKTYLPEDILALSDRLSMWHSLEVRVPLATQKLFEFGAQLGTKQKITLRGKKLILRDVAKEYLPDAVINHKKQGFEAPMANWLRHDLKQYCNDTLSQQKLSKIGIFN
ncbi:MAG: asparagine synthase (glutamine-hydrolyzing), partial [Gammaproteobacteria bacterium]|nr:asparagine synthase (glutamine-hydrolyzing) [Gammaproteobacteria bacterium]